ncbi:MAG TPA: hypothetical protein VJU15_05820, partial [Gemmatimonadales bacterium]|nr:hypothetical protein [Gemmatimonadales bacterium]
LTFGGLGTSFVPAEGVWCGELISAAPDLGLKCDPATVFGRLPGRYDQSRLSGTGGFTDIMSIPPSVARRAYQAAEGGANSAFFYVRRFEGQAGQPDVFVAVTCRMAGGGARVPLSLTDVRLGFAVETPVLFLAPGTTLPDVTADITYTGTGRLKGRWEVVRPGEELPEPRDLLPEAALPLEERGTQRRYTEVQRFNVFLPPGGTRTLEGPDPQRIPTGADGTYLLLLRIEASDDKEGDSNLNTAGSGEGVVHSGAVAGFPLPTLRYQVGSGGSELSPPRAGATMELTSPAEGARLSAGESLEFTWTTLPNAALFRLEIETLDRKRVFSALVLPGTTGYQAPPWIAELANGAALRWRVVALNQAGGVVGRSTARRLEP